MHALKLNVSCPCCVAAHTTLPLVTMVTANGGDDDHVGAGRLTFNPSPCSDPVGHKVLEENKAHVFGDCAAYLQGSLALVGYLCVTLLNFAESDEFGIFASF